MSDHLIITDTPLWRNLGPKRFVHKKVEWPSVEAAWRGLGLNLNRTDLFVNGELRDWTDYEWLAE